MDWIQTGSILITILGTAYYIHRDLLADIKSFREELQAQGRRTDKLYEMFIDLIKDGRK